MVSLLVLGLGAGLAEAGDIEAGKVRAQACAGCHGKDGKAQNPEWPNLAGQNANYIVRQLKAFQAGTRKNELMSPMAQSLNDQDVENVAAYFSSLKACE
ncbi:MAG TPA: cytochrome c [Gammaproteobacteria bacterium]|nr:cytochrome c [Gammaproteobacteria bacterium]